MTLEPSRFFVIPQPDAEALLTGNPEFARHLVRKLIGRVRSLTEQVRSLALKDVYTRLVHFLEAARIGGSREMVSRILSDLSAGGYIAVEAKRIVLPRKRRPTGRGAGMCIWHKSAVACGVEVRSGRT